MRIILGGAGDTAITAMQYLLDMPTICFRRLICQSNAYLYLGANEEHPLHEEFWATKGTGLEGGKSWLDHVEDIVHRVCVLWGMQCLVK